MSSDALPDHSARVADLRCSHGTCGQRGAYVVAGRCDNCGWEGKIVVSRSHENPRRERCPRCDCRRLNGHEFAGVLMTREDADAYVAERSGASDEQGAAVGCTCPWDDDGNPIDGHRAGCAASPSSHLPQEGEDAPSL